MAVNANVDELLDIAEKAFSDAVEIHKLIEILETGNAPEIVESISKKRAGIAAYSIRNSLFWHLHLLVARSYGTARDGDRHLRRAFELLKLPDVQAAMSRSGSNEVLAEAQIFPSRQAG